MAAKPLLFSGRFFLFHGHDFKNQRNQVWYVTMVLKQQQNKAIFYKAMVSSSWVGDFEEVISLGTLWWLAGIWVYKEPSDQRNIDWLCENRSWVLRTALITTGGVFLFLIIGPKINIVIRNWLHLDMIRSRVIDTYGQTQATCLIELSASPSFLTKNENWRTSGSNYFKTLIQRLPVLI